MRTTTFCPRVAVPVACAALVAAAGLMLSACAEASSSPHPRPSAGHGWLTREQMLEARVLVAPITVREVDNQVFAGGVVEAVDPNVAHVFAPVGGTIRTVNATIGQRVAKGDRLVTIESTEVDTLDAEVEMAHAKMIAAEKERDRQRDSFNNHSGSVHDLDTAERSAAATRTAWERMQIRSAGLRASIIDKAAGTVTLRAPVDGEVLQSDARLGAEITAETAGSGLLFTLGEADPVRVMAEVREADLPRIHPGAAVTVKRDDAGDKESKGTVERISDVHGDNTQTATMQCQVPNPMRTLRPGQFVRVAVGVKGRIELAVSRSALLHVGSNKVVFVQRELAPGGFTRFERRNVTVDEDVMSDYIAVRSGLAEGELVVQSEAILVSGVVQ